MEKIFSDDKKKLHLKTDTY